MRALSDGNRDEEDVFRAARIAMEYQRLGPKIRQSFERAGRQLATNGLIVIDDGEYFLTADGRNAEVQAGARTNRPRQASTSRRGSTNPGGLAIPDRGVPLRTFVPISPTTSVTDFQTTLNSGATVIR